MRKGVKHSLCSEHSNNKIRGEKIITQRERKNKLKKISPICNEKKLLTNENKISNQQKQNQ